MIEIISLILGIALAVWIKRKGLTTVELRQYADEQLAATRKKLVTVKLYRWSTGNVWVHFNYQGWVQARWCTDANDGYLVRVDGTVGMMHKRFAGITIIEDYTKDTKP